jgi:hypothetical protein
MSVAQDQSDRNRGSGRPHAGALSTPPRTPTITATRSPQGFWSYGAGRAAPEPRSTAARGPPVTRRRRPVRSWMRTIEVATGHLQEVRGLVLVGAEPCGQRQLNQPVHMGVLFG